MWTSLFTITFVIALALGLAAIVVEFRQWRKVPSLYVAFCLKRSTWAAVGRPFLLPVGRYAARELCNNSGDAAAPDAVEALCAAVLVPVLRGIQR